MAYALKRWLRRAVDLHDRPRSCSYPARAIRLCTNRTGRCGRRFLRHFPRPIRPAARLAAQNTFSASCRRCRCTRTSRLRQFVPRHHHEVYGRMGYGRARRQSLRAYRASRMGESFLLIRISFYRDEREQHNVCKQGKKQNAAVPLTVLGQS